MARDEVAQPCALDLASGAAALAHNVTRVGIQIRLITSTRVVFFDFLVFILLGLISSTLTTFGYILVASFGLNVG